MTRRNDIAALLIEHGASISGSLGIMRADCLRVLNQDVDFTKMSEKNLTKLSRELLPFSTDSEVKKIILAIKAAEKMLHIGEWRPRKQQFFSTPFRKAMTTLVTLAKAESLTPPSC